MPRPTTDRLRTEGPRRATRAGAITVAAVAILLGPSGCGGGPADQDAPPVDRSATNTPDEAPTTDASAQTDTASEPDPADTITINPRPTWLFEGVRETDIGTFLVPGEGDAGPLLEARAAALRDARTNAAREGLLDGEYEETIRHAAGARLDTGEFRFWVVIVIEPSR